MTKDLRHFLSKLIIYGVGSVAQSVAGFILIPIFTKTYSAAEYGIYTMIWLVGMLFSSVMYLGVASALPKYFYIEKEMISRGSAFSTGYFLVFGAMLAQLGIGILFSNILSKIFFNNQTYAVHICLSIMGGAVVFLNYYMATFLRILDKAVEFIIFNLAMMIFTLLITYYLLNVQSDKLMSPFLAAFIVNLLFCILLTGFFFIHKSLQLRFSKPLAISMLAFGVPMAISSMASMVVDWSDRFILEYFAGLASVGVYSLAYKVAGLVNVLLVTPFVQIWGPVMMKKKNDADIKSFFLLVFQGYWFVSCSILMFLMFFYRNLESYIVKSSAYGDISMLVLMLTLGLLVYGLGNILNCGLLYANKTQRVMWINYTCAFVNVILSFALIPRYGAYGAAISTLIAYTSMPLIMHFSSRKYFDFSPFKQSASGLIQSCIFLSSLFFVYKLNLNILLLVKIPFFCIGLLVLALVIFWPKIKNARAIYSVEKL